MSCSRAATSRGYRDTRERASGSAVPGSWALHPGSHQPRGLALVPLEPGLQEALSPCVREAMPESLRLSCTVCG